MTLKVAINGFGRIGRNILRAHYEDGKKHDLQFVAVNDLGDAKTNAHLLKYDTAHGRFKGTVAVEGDAIVVNGDRLTLYYGASDQVICGAELSISAVLAGLAAQTV